jgi:hypothetical protein
MNDQASERKAKKRERCRLDIQMFLDTVERTQPVYDELSLALRSVAKRVLYSRLHFHELGKCLTDHKLELERAGLKFTDAGNIGDNRTYYEAHTNAFVQNLHAVCDSFPHVVSLMLGPLKCLDKNRKPILLRRSKYGWSESFFNAVEYTHPLEKVLHRRLKRFMGDQDFLILKGLVNQNKHQYLVRILNHRTHLAFERIEYHNKPTGGAKVMLSNVDALAIMTRWHNVLFPRLFVLFWTLRQARINLALDY